MSSGWSWSPTRALAQLNSNIQPIPQPNFAAKTPLPGIASLDLARPIIPPPAPAAVPRSAQINQIMPPVAAGRRSKPATATATATAPASTEKPAAASKKRKCKSDAAAHDKEELFPEDVPEIDDDDPRLDCPRETCNAIRRKIRNWTESGAMKIGEFQDALGVSSKAYTSFMNRTGAWDGEGCDTYFKAGMFFKKRELQGLPLKASKPKKPKTAASTAAAKKKQDVDISEVTLPGEDKGAVPIYDTCDEVRKKTRAHLARDGTTQAGFVREISKTFPDERKVSAANLRYFMGQKGPLGGNTNVAFYAAYVFFEKVRVAQNKPKTKFREEMEKVHKATGVDTEHGSGAGVFCHGDERPYIDKYAKLQFIPSGAVRRR